MRRFGLFVASLMMTSALALVPGETSAAEPAPVEASQSEFHGAFVKLSLTRDGNTFQHPGFMMAADEEAVFVINCDGKDHEITIAFKDAGETRFTLRVDYAIDGHTQWVEDVEAEAGRDAEVTHGKSNLAINVDPQGSEDTSRDEGDKIDDPGNDEDDPLGGLPLRKT